MHMGAYGSLNTKCSGATGCQGSHAPGPAAPRGFTASSAALPVPSSGAAPSPHAASGPWLLRRTSQALSQSARDPLEPYFKASDSQRRPTLAAALDWSLAAPTHQVVLFLIFSLKLMMLRTSSLITKKKKEVPILVKNKVKS